MNALRLFNQLPMLLLIQRTNKRLLLVPKLLYFGICLFFYAFHANKVKYIKQKFNLSCGKVGAWLSLTQIVATIFGIKIGNINDKYGIQKFVLLTAVGVGSALFSGLFFVESFPIYITLFTIYFSLVAISLPLIDKIVLDYLISDPNTTQYNYGKQRMFSTITYIYMAFLIERLVKKTPTGCDYSKLIPFGIIGGIIGCIIVFLFVRNLPRRENAPDALDSTLILLSSLDYVYFLLIILLSGIVRAVLTSNLTTYFDEVMGFKDAHVSEGKESFIMHHIHDNKIGILILAGNLFEFPVFMISNHIFNFFGLIWPLVFGQIFQILRMSGYCFLSKESNNVFVKAFLLELLKGINFGLIQGAGATLADGLCPPYLRSTSQLLYNGVYTGMGTVLAGILYIRVLSKTDLESFHNMFLYNALLSGIVLVLIIGKYGVVDGYLTNRKKFDELMSQMAKMEEYEEYEDIEEIDESIRAI